jgi:hypothetical protein
LDAIQKHHAKPVAPSPDAGLEAVKAEVADQDGAGGAIDAMGKRLAELEIQGRVLRGYVHAQGHYRKWVRLEDEERERARKAGKP